MNFRLFGDYQFLEFFNLKFDLNIDNDNNMIIFSQSDQRSSRACVSRGGALLRGIHGRESDDGLDAVRRAREHLRLSQLPLARPNFRLRFSSLRCLVHG